MSQPRERLKARDIIAKECEAGILRVFPSQWLDRTLQEVNQAAAKGDASARTAKKAPQRSKVQENEGLVMWFAANLLFESVHADQSHTDNLWEERVVLLHASSEDEARQQATALGKADEHSYVSATHERVHWYFRQIERVCAIETEKLESGTELYSRFLRASEVQSLLAPMDGASTGHLHSQTV